MTPTGGALKTIADRPIKITVNVSKKWMGPTGSSVTVRLLADGNGIDKTFVLDAAGGWKSAFSGLPEFAAAVAAIAGFAALVGAAAYRR